MKIGGHEFRVELVEVVDKHHPKRGDIDHLAAVIHISRDLCESKREQTLLHEVLHELDQQFYTELDEQTIARLAEGLYQVLRENRLWFGFESAAVRE